MLSWRHGCIVPWYNGAVAPRYHGTVASWHMVPWSHGTMVPWHRGTMVPLYHGTTVSWYHATMQLWYHGTMAPWCNGTWYHDTMAPRYHATYFLRAIKHITNSHSSCACARSSRGWDRGMALRIPRNINMKMKTQKHVIKNPFIWLVRSLCFGKVRKRTYVLVYDLGYKPLFPKRYSSHSTLEMVSSNTLKQWFP